MDHDAILDALEVETAPFALCELTPRGRLVMPRSQLVSLHYVLSGSGTVHIAGQPATAVGEGDLVLVPAALSHSLAAADGAYVALARCQPAALGLQHHRPNQLEGDVSAPALVVLCASMTLGLRGAGPVIDLVRSPLIESARDSRVAGRALGLMIEELTNPRLGSRAMIRTLLLECVIDMLRRRIAANEESVAWIVALSDRGLWPVLRVMLDDPGASHTVESLAERVGMSRSRFAERFQRSFGTGPMEILRGLRLQYAARLLLEGNAGIARVAELAGYSSRSHFTEQFEGRFGLPPGRFRREAQH